MSVPVFKANCDSESQMMKVIQTYEKLGRSVCIFIVAFYLRQIYVQLDNLT